MNPLELGRLVAGIAAEKKAKRPVLIDLQNKSDVCEMQFICSGDNERQTKAIAKAIDDTLRSEYKIKPYAIEGLNNGSWVLLDYGGLNIHVFFDQYRDYYALEQIWPDAEFIKL